jgi:hypothetical protein
MVKTTRFLKSKPIFVFGPRLWFQSDFHWLPFPFLDPRPQKATIETHNNMHSTPPTQPEFISGLFTPIFAMQSTK